jgi:flagellar hook-associated protein 3 FlgL
MRVSLRNQYSNFLYNVQNTQSRLMDLNMQASSQKRINKPSDDPGGAARVLNYRLHLWPPSASTAAISTRPRAGSGWPTNP